MELTRGEDPERREESLIQLDGEKRALLLVNPHAGHGRARRLATQLPEAAASLGWQVERWDTDAGGHEVELAARAAEEGWPVLVVVGGDGTVHGAANGLLQQRSTDTVLAHVPIGTGNDFAKLVGLNKSDKPANNLWKILNGKLVHFDVGRALNEYFVNSVGIGFAAEAARNLLKYKGLGGFSAYVVAVYRTFFTYKAPELSVTVGSFRERGAILMVEISIGRTTGGGFTVTPDADPCDGLLDVCMIREVGSMIFLRHVPSVIRGTHVGLPFVEIFQAELAEVETCAGPGIVHLDGEVREADTKKVTVQIVPGVLPVLCAT